MNSPASGSGPAGAMRFAMLAAAILPAVAVLLVGGMSAPSGVEADAAAQSWQIPWAALGVIATAAVAAVLTAGALARSANAPIEQATDVAQALAAGDLTAKLTGSQGTLAAALDSLRAQLSARSETAKQVANEAVASAGTDDSSAAQKQLAILRKSQLVAEFDLSGHVTLVNDRWLSCMGYAQADVIGRSHSMLVDSEVAASREYRELWEALRRGEARSGEFRRVGAGGREVWLQSAYLPIADDSGELLKVVQYAVDITQARQQQIAMTAMLGEVTNVMSALSGGVLSARIAGQYTGEFAQLQSSVNDYSRTMAEMVDKIKQAADTVKTASFEISEGNLNLSQRTEQQASSLEETSSNMEEMTTTVQQNAENAEKANQLAIDAREHAAQGGQVVGSAVRAMAEINEASNKIADIIVVIDEIAFQTNLLALNASVEAARAGEQGRGFAVVAGEVRNLAGRSATAAKKIKELIRDSVSKIEDGSALVNQSGETLETIVSSVQKLTDIVGEISAASSEQASGIRQVNNAIVHMDESTQQNAALVEEASAASDSMRHQAQQLAQLMNFFDIGSADGAARAGSSGGQARANRRPTGDQRANTSARQTAANKATPTSGSTAAAPEQAQQPRVERRKAGRPWAGREPSRDEQRSVAATQRAVGDDNDTEWQEF